MSFYTTTQNSVKLFVKAVPNAPKSEIIGEYDGALKIKIKAQPIEGKANAELIAFLAKTFKIAKSQIELDKGETSKHKTVLLPLCVLEQIKGIENGKNG